MTLPSRSSEQSFELPVVTSMGGTRGCHVVVPRLPGKVGKLQPEAGIHHTYFKHFSELMTVPYLHCSKHSDNVGHFHEI